MQNLKKLLLVGLVALSLSPVALAVNREGWCPHIAGQTQVDPSNPKSGDVNKTANSTQTQYSYNDTVPGYITSCPATTPSEFFAVLSRIFSIGALIIAAISGLLILSAAFMYVTSHGDEEKVSTAKNTIIYAIMGLVLAGLAYGIPTVISSLLFS